jgi:hypothetical protein
MSRATERPERPATPARAARRTWIEFEAPEVIELKRIVLDKDAEAAVAFFHGVVVPKVRAAAERHGMILPTSEELVHERLPG